jgi:hypothetical protein
MSLYYDFMCILVYLLVYVLVENEHDAFSTFSFVIDLGISNFDMNCASLTKKNIVI